MIKTLAIQPEFLKEGQSLPVVLRPMESSVCLQDWAQAHRDLIDELLVQFGGILFRDFKLSGVEGFENFIKTQSRELMGYQDRATPRSQVQGHIFTATDYPPEHNIFLHNESSFAHTFPSKIFFYCITAPQEGGQTPIADVRRVYSRLNTRIRDCFIQKGVLYIRNFGDRLFGLPWQEVFQTEDKTQMEDYCKRAGIEVEWKDANRLRTRQVRPAVLNHPKTGESVWFNHTATLNVSTIETKLRATLLKMFKPEDLPNNSY